jgi:hypothetical protein
MRTMINGAPGREAHVNRAPLRRSRFHPRLNCPWIHESASVVADRPYRAISILISATGAQLVEKGDPAGMDRTWAPDGHRHQLYRPRQRWRHLSRARHCIDTSRPRKPTPGFTFIMSLASLGFGPALHSHMVAVTLVHGLLIGLLHSNADTGRPRTCPPYRVTLVYRCGPIRFFIRLSV